MSPEDMDQVIMQNEPMLEGLPDNIREWILHLDLHMTEHDDHHARLALLAAWPTVREYFLELRLAAISYVDAHSKSSRRIRYKASRELKALLCMPHP